MEGEVAFTMTTLLSNIGTILESSITWMGSIASAVASNPLLMLGVVIPFVGFGVGLFKRLLRL